MSTRRSFIQQAGVLTTGLLLGESTDLLANSFKRPKQIGLQLYTLRDELGKDVKGTMTQLGKIGFNHVETYFGYDPKGKNQFWGLSAKELKTLLSDNGLKTHSGHYQINDLLTPGDEKLDALKFQLDLVAQLGQKYFVVPIPPFGTWDKLNADSYKFMAAQFNKAAEIAQKSGIKFAYHNHFWEFRKFEGGKTGFDIMATESDPKLVQFELDLFWATKAGANPVELFKKYPKRIVMWHVKDMDKTQTETVYTNEDPTPPVMSVLTKVKFAEVGSGAIPFKDIFKHTEDLKYYFVEQDQITMPNKFDSVKQSLEYIKKNL
jgi:sugar phosphate isomerase/epimerase